jgi:Tripartite ATP-independent periplasmic transporter, DctM component
LQTSFLTPPFGFALFYLRSVAAKADYKDRVTGKLIPAVTTTQIYKGSIAFIILQLIMVGVVMWKPGLVLDNIDNKSKVLDTSNIKLEAEGQAPVKSDEDVMKLFEQKREQQYQENVKTDAQREPTSTEPAKPESPVKADEDPAKALMDSLKKDEAKK